MENLYQRINKVAEELKEMPLISQVEYKLTRPARLSVIDSIRREDKVVLPSTLEVLFVESNGFSIRWKFRPAVIDEFQSEHIPGGELNVLPVTDIYSWPTKDKLWFDDMDKQGTQGPSYKAFCQQLRILENLLESTESVFIVMSPEWLGKKVSYADPKILFWNTTGAKYLLSLTLENYFEACIEAKAFSGWQCFYIDEEGMNAGHPFVTEYLASNFNEAKTKRERFLREMPRLFPEMDISKFSELHSKLS